MHDYRHSPTIYFWVTYFSLQISLFISKFILRLLKWIACKKCRGIKEITPSNKILKLRVFWSKQRKSIWISAWNLAFSVFISPIWYQYESVNFKALQKSHTKAKDTTDQKRKKKKGRNVNYIKHLRIYKNQHRNSYVYIITYISNRICFAFHFKYLFFIYRWK